ncbi:transglutaminase-like domain-containing protein [Paenibacillus puerhi]|uniref:transglutaminase-like domain-containing protein n=1 Tax=Paenibacillus puerhi TaxID=2692622 RepID=UPI00135CDBDF|nr:transglutaminase-like domain-containing protein [Paenibacillus puerhi]
MRKWIAMIVAVCLLTLYLPAAAWAAAKEDSDSWLNTGKLEQGVIGIIYKSPSAAKTKLMVSKDNVSYTYDLSAVGQEEFFSLQLHNGIYKITVLQQVTGNKYRTVHSDTLDLQMKNEAAVYLNSVQNIKWNEADAVIEKARELTRDKKTEREKAQAIYDYLIKTIVYDFDLAANVSTGYIPNLNQVLAAQKGICYDYASLFAAMNRSVGIPTKLVMGSSDHVKEYHAWNEIYLDGAWVTVDTTVDAGTGSGTFAKNASEYKVTKVY